MSVDCVASVFAGVLLRTEDIKAILDKQFTQQQAGCNHPFPKGANFCPQCGAPRFKDLKSDLQSWEIINFFAKQGFDVASTTDSVSIVVGKRLSGTVSSHESEIQMVAGLSKSENAVLNADLVRILSELEINEIPQVDTWVVMCSY